MTPFVIFFFFVLHSILGCIFDCAIFYGCHTPLDPDVRETLGTMDRI